jgi:hypothetical protein
MKRLVLRLAFWDSIEASETKEDWRAGSCVLIYSAAGTRPATCFRLRNGFAMPDVVDFKPVRARFGATQAAQHQRA